MTLSNRLDFALETARQAGALLRGFEQRQAVGYKSSEIDIVTAADLASERLIVDAIRARFPEHSILSEEGLGDLHRVAAEIPHLWLVDPLDGTVNYAHGFPVWGVTLALAERGRVVLGVIYDPLRDEMFWAEEGQGAWCNGQRLHVSATGRLREALVATGFAYQRAALSNASHGDAPGNNLAEFGVIMPRVQGIRRAGAATLDLAYLAAGRLDAYWEMYLQPWDWAAGTLLVQEAGGQVSDLTGAPWSPGTNGLAASNGLLHAELLALLRQADGRHAQTHVEPKDGD
ncbi:MAG TPA: inositol monophosphatase [Anaerolineae bacterium]|nr:inositol monophosphatase [Anaerolineae bacterium]